MERQADKCAASGSNPDGARKGVWGRTTAFRKLARDPRRIAFCGERTGQASGGGC
ncbi:MAG TPA: hypothetical protein VGP72_01335 [Planctomycetota bacterium]|jgi:hypothetical protein